MTTKAELRGEARKRLAGLSESWRAGASEAIASRIWQLPPLSAARTILIYAALPSEVETAGIAAGARERGIAVAYPRCFPEGREMSLHLVAREAELEEGGRYGIREPALVCPVTELSEVDVAFVPGLGWDRTGGRLGRGAGYYDRLLGAPGWRGFTCGLFFALQEFPAIPTDPWDVHLDAIATEEEVVRP